MAKRVGSMFAQTAKQDGKVIKVTANGIQVEYKDGTVKGYEIGRTFGAYSGLTLPHSLKAHVVVGQEVKEGDVLYYNEGFFEPDTLDPKQVIWKKAMLCKVVLLESTQTLEDASSISKALASKLTTAITKTKEVTLTFDQVVRSIKSAGDALEPDSILCIIEDAVTAGAKLFDEESLDTLRLLSNQSPRSKVKGILERVEVYYHGDKEDMSESLRALADASDAQMAKRRREAGKKPVSGSVTDDMRVGGEPLQIGQLVIRFYITSQVPAVIGD